MKKQETKIKESNKNIEQTSGTQNYALSENFFEPQKKQFIKNFIWTQLFVSSCFFQS